MTDVKIMVKNNVPLFLVAAALAVGVGAGLGSLVSAQSVAPSPSSADSGVPSNAHQPMRRGHAPLGGDGIVSSINGTIVVMAEEADEGGASYTVDASGLPSLRTALPRRSLTSKRVTRFLSKARRTVPLLRPRQSLSGTRAGMAITIA